MADPVAKPIYLVDPSADPVQVRIEGRACFQNCACLRDFVTEMRRQGKCRFVVDFQLCLSMDSTFLGVLAGAALDLRKLQPPGSMVLTRVGPRNLELFRNLGLHRLLVIDAGDSKLDVTHDAAPIPCREHTELEQARLALEAHENLVACDEANRGKFQDVLSFLKNRVDQG
jgi:anti-anti-sigma regulatory factor